MLKYTLHISHTLVAKNKLQEDIEHSFRRGNHIIYDNLEKLQSLMRNKIEELNMKNHRCKPVKIAFGSIYDNERNSIPVWGIPNITASILILKEVKNEN